MREIYLVTHPEATHVVEGLVGGWYDADLTANGIEQAERIATSIAARTPHRETALTSSDLRRTRRTAEAIAGRLDVDPLLDPGLREQSYGAAEGLPVGTIDFLPLPVAGDRIRHHDGVTGSETRLDFATRVYAALDRVIERGAEHSVVVTHGGSATFLIAAWIGMPLESLGSVKFKLSPGSISVLRQHDLASDRQVVSLNEVEHLN
ncbi:histidine phosphatase family protein [Nocardioides sp. AX2bis]|uniref:histidine phosphatase family protein n=1 Tax=Nocardioides sp. AX2bis TaxID=2653157 RepID=UPI0012F3C52F|nr:histidine phosphatase family protein [Nocardioides sp. AX2bis]VXB59873.1 Phosphoglycerate kinase [Nocardioides sp. AX2bis]